MLQRCRGDVGSAKGGRHGGRCCVGRSITRMSVMKLLLAEYSIKTKYSVSLGIYSSTNEHPAQEPGQGSYIAPALWLFICCLLFLMRWPTFVKVHGLLQPRTNCFQHQHTGDGFVDELTNFFNFGLAAMFLHNYGPLELAKGLQEEAHNSCKKKHRSGNSFYS